MKPSNQEIKETYEKKLSAARIKLAIFSIGVREVQVFQKNLPWMLRGKLEREITKRGCAVTLANLNGMIKHCKFQINKWSLKISEYLPVE